MASANRRGDRPAGKGAPAAAKAALSPFDCIDAVFVAEARSGSDLPAPTDPEIAFAGRSNVGKSTLLNRLCQRKSLARTSKTPGCTRGVVLFRATLRDKTRFVIADLPGYGFAERSKGERVGWGSLIENYLKRREALAGVVILIDGRRGLQDEEHQLIEYLQHLGRPFLLIATKIDKLSVPDRARALATLRRETRGPVLGVSGATGEGREELLRQIVDLLSPDEAETLTVVAREPD
jgi:GTP-binding protein